MAEEKKSGQIIHLFGKGNNVSGRDVVNFQKPKTLKQVIRGSNNVSVTGDNNRVEVNLHGLRPPRPQIVPGDEEVTNEQAAEIKALVSKAAEVSGQAYQKVYAVLYRKLQTTSYLMIKRNRYEEAVSYLRKWIARNAPSPTGSAEDERKRLLRRVYADARKQRGALDQIHAYIKGRFGTDSLADLAPGQLRDVIAQFRL